MSIADDFQSRFPEFSSAVLTTYLDTMVGVYPAYYAIEYTTSSKEATLNCIAHLISLETKQGAKPSRIEASKSADGVSVSYQAQTQKGGELYDFFNTTKYGQRFLMLSRSRQGGFAV